MIDLRSDVCSVPTDAMWEAMREAELGWALVGEDASVNTLCERVAELLGKAGGDSGCRRSGWGTSPRC